MSADAQAQQRRQAAAKFTGEMVAKVRQRLFSTVSEKEWFAVDRDIVAQAVMAPARYLHERGAALPASRYQTILLTVIVAIEDHGKVAEVRRMSAYLLKSVQDHMRFQGERYYEEAKAGRDIAPAIAATMGKLRVTTDDQATTEALAAASAALATTRRGGRRRKTESAGIQQELF